MTPKNCSNRFMLFIAEGTIHIRCDILRSIHRLYHHRIPNPSWHRIAEQQDRLTV